MYCLNLIQIFTNAKFVVLLGICFSLLLFNADNFYNIKIYGHQFTPNETATFAGIIDQVQAELQLVGENLMNDNVSLAHSHAIKVASLLTQRIIAEIAEDNPRLASDIIRATDQLQKIPSSSVSQKEKVNHLVNDLNKRLGEETIVRIAQVQPNAGNFFDSAVKILGSIFGGSGTQGDDQNSKLEALAFANVIDAVLTNYGGAFNVGFDMTNMSNMVMVGNNSSPGSMVMSNTVTGNSSGSSNMKINMRSMNTSSNMTTEHAGEMNTGYSLVNLSDYQSALALAKKASEVFNTKLKPTTMSNIKNVTGFVTNLENGITQLNDSIAKQASPLDIMMIVHTQIHPNLLETYNLQLRK
jgi:hypothetical protein